jgi:type VI secretion system protein ImpC
MPEPIMVNENSLATLEKQPTLLDRILDEGLRVKEPEDRDACAEWLRILLDKVLPTGRKVSAETDALINQQIAEIDKALTVQINEIMHDPKLQKLEGGWRGLKYLVSQTETSTMLKIKVLSMSKRDLLKDLRNAVDFDQSAMFKLIHNEGYGMLGGEPFACIIGDYEFSRGPEDMEILEKMSNVAAASHAPFIAAASPQMFNFESFTELNEPRDLAKVFQSDFYIRWRAFRDSDDSRFVALTLPHVLMRLPYGHENIKVEAFDFEEDVNGLDHRKYCWGNSAYALGARITNAFKRYGWCAAIRGVEGGGLVEDLPLHAFEAPEGDPTSKTPTEVKIPDRRDAEISKLGFVPLIYYDKTNSAAFIETRSVQKPAVFLDDDANSNAELSARLQYIFATSRFAHYLKVMMRDKVGKFMSREQCEVFLNDWIKHYVLLDDMASHEQKAMRPLRDARVEVTDIPGKPGAYKAIAYLRPHFQLEELKVSLRLVANLPKQK